MRKPQPSGISTVLKNGMASAPAELGVFELHDGEAREDGDGEFDERASCGPTTPSDERLVTFR